MKKVFIAFFALTLSAGSFAQNPTNENSMTQQNMQKKDGVMMKDGKTWVTKDGQTAVLTQDLVLADGTTVSPDGTVKLKDGTSATLKEGDYIKMDGTRGNVADWKKDNNPAKDTLKTP